MRSKKLWFAFALVCMVCGAILCGVGIGMGGKLHDSYGVHYGTDGIGVGVGWLPSEDEYETKRIALTDFSALQMDISIGDIRIERGNTLELYVEKVAKDTYEVYNEGDTLVVKSWEDDHDFFSNLKDLDSKFILRIPEHMDLDHVIITSNMGDVKIIDIAIETLEVDQHMGDIKVLDVISKTMTLNQNMGDIEYEGKCPGNLEAYNDMGDIDVKIDAHMKDYAYDLNTSMGTIKVNDRTISDGMSASLNDGKANALYRLTLYNSMGDIDLEFDHD